ncbi:ABC transporter substrate-binding protein [Streptomyces sp. NBC_00006]|uniref:ABC transporter substrate-binding protein n=1 Tax=unclassified Streptomyces TaxID=2593676 RepID=UPI002259C2B4|nr:MULTISPECIES: ABC transporter substrate-binding protein [unclassified Streptomyces]MCX5537055.1 ABC transporter substrate-binding protein [Streptomyces sp. NBC_00006]
MTPDRTPVPPGPRSVERRMLLRAGGGVLAAASLSGTLTGCGFFSTDAENGDSAGGGSKGKEAPSLKKQADAGKIPKVAERLPAKPLVVEPLQETGAYGGTWHSAMITQEDLGWLRFSVGYEPLVRWAATWQGVTKTKILPNVCEKYEINGGGEEFVFHLRKGMRWSDGKPLTAEDFEFAFNDYNADPKVHPAGLYALWLNKNGKPARCEAVDDHTVKYVFDEPKAGFLEEVAGTTGVFMFLPKHFMKKYLPKYNKDANKDAKAAGASDWLTRLETVQEVWQNPELPTVNAWLPRNPVTKGSSVVCERNPYYWKVDPDGSQLPYIDKVVVDVLQEVEVEVLKISNGDLDMQMYQFGTVRNKPVISRNRSKGGYRIAEVEPDSANTMIIGFNQTHPDKKKRALFADKDFRVGLSYAINRKKIIETVFAGQGRPWQAAPGPDNELHNEELGTQYTAYSVAKANEYLDKAGFTKRNGDGIRLTKDGDPVAFTVLVVSDMADQVDAMDMIRSDWRKVGVDATVSRMAETLYWERVEAGKSEAATWDCNNFDVRTGEGGNHYYAPTNPRGSSRFGGEWAKWYLRKDKGTGGDGEEPPARIKHQLELFDEMRDTFDIARATRLAKQILEITKEEFYYIGISTPPKDYAVIKNTLRNVPKAFSAAGLFQAPGPTNPSTYYFKAKA